MINNQTDLYTALARTKELAQTLDDKTTTAAQAAELEELMYEIERYYEGCPCPIPN